jgi:parvulin-like peptidyl-prolyl isomerase
MTAQETLAARALAMGLDRDPEVRRAYHNLLAGRLRQLKLEPLIEQAQASEEETRRRYEANLDRYRVPPRQRLAMLRVAVDRTMTAERREQARQRLEAARERALTDPNGNGFGVLATEYSEHQASRYRGGEIGWIEPGRESSRWDPALIAAGAALVEPGEISPVIEGRDAFYVVKLLETQPGSVVSFEQAAPAVRQRLLAETRQDIERAFLREVQASVPVRIHDRVVQTLPPGTGRIDREPRPPSLP